MPVDGLHKLPSAGVSAVRCTTATCRIVLGRQDAGVAGPLPMRLPPRPKETIVRHVGTAAQHPNPIAGIQGTCWPGIRPTAAPAG